MRMSYKEGSRFTARLVGVSVLSWVGIMHTVRRCG
jgi:hypothetical protein